MKFNFDATNKAVIDEYRQVGVAGNPEDRVWVDVRGDTLQGLVDDTRVEDHWKNNFKDFGRNKAYSHTFDINYTAPLKYIPAVDWVTVKAKYNGGYRWTASSLDFVGLDGVHMGDIIENSQERTLNATFGFDKLYKKSKFLKEVERKRKRKKKVDKDEKKKRGDISKAPEPKKETKTDKDRKVPKKKGSSVVAKLLVRPLLSLRSVKFNYRESLGTIVPGIDTSLVPNLMGLSQGFDAPGFGFVSGWQPDLSLNNENNWLRQAESKGWISSSKFLNNQVSQKRTQTYDMKVEIEPYRDLKLTIDFKKQFTKDLFETFKDLDPSDTSEDFQQITRREIGSFEITYFGLNTFFNNDVVGMYTEFLGKRAEVSQMLNPTGGAHPEDGSLYREGFGAVHSNVVLPAFISTYTGRALDESWVRRDAGQETTAGLIYEVSRNSFLPKPNWTLRYNGLKSLPFFEDILSQFTLTHTYKGTMRINQFRTNLDFTTQNYNATNPVSGNYYSRFEVPTVQISEQFSPLLGIQMKTKKDLVFNIDYKKSRALDLSTDLLGKLTEKRSTGMTVGLGWTKQDVNIGFLTGDKKAKKKRQKKDGEEGDEEDAEEDKKDTKKKNNRGGLGRGNVNNNRPRDLTFNFDFSFQDDITHEHEYVQGLVDAQGTRGQRSVSFNPSVDYNINENLTLRLFFDYQSSKPVNTASGTTKTTRYYGGLTARFNLQ